MFCEEEKEEEEEEDGKRSFVAVRDLTYKFGEEKKNKIAITFFWAKFKGGLNSQEF